MNEERGVNEATKDGGRRGVGASRGGGRGEGGSKKAVEVGKGKKKLGRDKKKGGSGSS